MIFMLLCCYCYHAREICTELRDTQGNITMYGVQLHILQVPVSHQTGLVRIYTLTTGCQQSSQWGDTLPGNTVEDVQVQIYSGEKRPNMWQWMSSRHVWKASRHTD